MREEVFRMFVAVFGSDPERILRVDVSSDVRPLLGCSTCPTAVAGVLKQFSFSESRVKTMSGVAA